MSKCEWNPVEHCAAEEPSKAFDCQNEATLSVGADGQWHLCQSCATDPYFKRFKTRAVLGKGDGQ